MATLCLHINYMMHNASNSKSKTFRLSKSCCAKFFICGIYLLTDLKLILHCGYNLFRSQPWELIEYLRPSSLDKQAVTTVSSSCAGSLVTPIGQADCPLTHDSWPPD